MIPMKGENTMLVSVGIDKKIPSRSYWRLIWGSLLKNKGAIAGLIFLVLIIGMTVFATVLATHPVETMTFENRFEKPSSRHFLGTDEFGRDIFSRLLIGGQISLMTGLLTVAIAGSIGTVLGLIAGYFRRLELIITQLVDILLAFPALLLAIAIIAVLGVGLPNAMIAVAIALIPSYVRVVRGAVLSIKEKEYIEAARALGVRDAKIISKHIFPNILSPLIVLSTLQIGNSILIAAELSFLGLGAQPPSPEWGAMIFVGRSFLANAWWMSLFPGLAIIITVLAFNLLGDGLRDALDPRVKK